MENDEPTEGGNEEGDPWNYRGLLNGQKVPEREISREGMSGLDLVFCMVLHVILFPWFCSCINIKVALTIIYLHESLQDLIDLCLDVTFKTTGWHVSKHEKGTHFIKFSSLTFLWRYGSITTYWTNRFIYFAYKASSFLVRCHFVRELISLRQYSIILKIGWFSY